MSPDRRREELVTCRRRSRSSRSPVRTSASCSWASAPAGRPRAPDGPAGEVRRLTARRRPGLSLRRGRPLFAFREPHSNVWQRRSGAMSSGLPVTPCWPAWWATPVRRGDLRLVGGTPSDPGAFRVLVDPADRRRPAPRRTSEIGPVYAESQAGTRSWAYFGSYQRAAGVRAALPQRRNEPLGGALSNVV